LDLLERLELAQHNCDNDATPPQDAIDDRLLLSEGSMDKLVVAAGLAVDGGRDLKPVAHHRMVRAQLTVCSGAGTTPAPVAQEPLVQTTRYGLLSNAALGMGMEYAQTHYPIRRESCETGRL
jgi:hypothetical protein